MKKVILASFSPQRQELFKKLGFAFEVRTGDFNEEDVEIGDPWRMAKARALGKARSAAEGLRGALVVGADTVVFHDGEILGKPRDEKHAEAMLARLNGKPHTVITGFAVYDADTHNFLLAHDETRVYLKPLTELEIEAYVKSGEPFGKAGGYAIQGLAGFFVDKIEGDYHNVVGLPIAALAKSLAEFGLS